MPSEQNTTGPQFASNIETIASLHAEAERSVPRHQRFIETLTGHLGRPITLYMIAVSIILWTVGNAFEVFVHRRAYDPPPFAILQCAVAITSLVISTMVLITQNRQAKLAEQRSHLDIQVNLLAEQKITKLIELIEELRRDLPNVRNRTDATAESMLRAADPQTMLHELERTMQEAEKIADETERQQ